MKDYLKPRLEPLGDAGIAALQEHTQHEIQQHLDAIAAILERLRAEEQLRYKS